MPCRLALKAGLRIALLTGGALLSAATLASAAEPWQLPMSPAPKTTDARKGEPLPRQAPEAELSADDGHYDRMCDVFGEGFTYSPSTSTCVKVGGYIQFGAAIGARH